MSMIRKATRQRAKLRLGIMAPSNGGKTMTAMAIASTLGRFCVIDTENGSADKYAGERNPTGGTFDFDVITLTEFHPNKYIEAISEVVKAGYDAVVIDGLTPAWDATQRLVDEEVIRTKGNSFQIWGRVGQVYNNLMKTIVACPIHVIATMRSKTEYVMEEDHRGKKVPKKVGLAPQVRQGAEYEFDIVLELDHEHNCWANKTRCSALDGKTFAKPGRDLTDIITGWLSAGVEPIATPAVPAPNLGNGELAQEIQQQAQVASNDRAEAKALYDKLRDVNGTLADDIRKRHGSDYAAMKQALQVALETRGAA